MALRLGVSVSQWLLLAYSTSFLYKQLCNRHLRAASFTCDLLCTSHHNAICALTMETSLYHYIPNILGDICWNISVFTLQVRPAVPGIYSYNELYQKHHPPSLLGLYSFTSTVWLDVELQHFKKHFGVSKWGLILGFQFNTCHPYCYLTYIWSIVLIFLQVIFQYTKYWRFNVCTSYRAQWKSS